VDPARGVDPAMLEECGISGEDAQAMLNPAPCLADTPVAQPAYDPAVPNMAYPVETLKAILAAPDAAITMQGTYDKPPVEA
nr:hypothetical protein [Novosphingobium sp.]